MYAIIYASSIYESSMVSDPEIMGSAISARSGRRRVRRALLTLTAIALLFFLGPRMLELLARKMLYPAPLARLPSPPPAPLLEVRLQPSPAGPDVVAWGFDHPPPENPAAERDRAAVVFFHGNGENLATMLYAGLFDDLERLGVHFLAVEYPGYGPNRGKPAEASLVAAGLAGLEWLAERYPASPKVVLGWSLGAAVAVQVARRSEWPVDRLALLSAWDDLPALASAHFPRWLVALGLSDRYDSVAAAAEIVAPTLLVHGTADTIIPLEHGERLHAAFTNGAELIEVPGAGHNDLLSRPEVWRELRRFLAPSRAEEPP